MLWTTPLSFGIEGRTDLKEMVVRKRVPSVGMPNPKDGTALATVAFAKARE
jgi:hypothetical protein